MTTKKVVTSKKSLPTADPSLDKLGSPTIMDRALAERHGVPYVHLAVFAIDVDRVREAVEGYHDPRPFGWEVFLAECYLCDRFDPIHHPEEVGLMEDVVLSILDGAPDALGSQLAFAIHDAIARGRFPKRLEGAFKSWEARPTELERDLATLFVREAELRRELAEGCLEVALTPPLAPPTRDALTELAR